MKSLFLLLLSFVGFANAAPLVYQGTEGPGKGKHIVFVAGDHEYRSEESLPELARILAKHHGFKCTVLFDIDQASGEIVAGNSDNMPGMEALDTADLMVVFTRFQKLPKEQMEHFDAYLNRGGPVIGMRTATHGFKMGADDPFAKYSNSSKVPGYEMGFGHQVLGQNWVGHYGTNHKQSTRITIVDGQAGAPDSARGEGHLGAGGRLCRQAGGRRNPHRRAAAQRHDAGLAGRRDEAADAFRMDAHLQVAPRAKPGASSPRSTGLRRTSRTTAIGACS